MSIKEKLARLHGSRRRAEQRSERDDETTGTYTADEAREYSEPPGETRTPEPNEEGEEKERQREQQEDERETNRDEPTEAASAEQSPENRRPDDTTDDETAPDASRGGVAERLSRSYSMRNRSGAPTNDDVSRETNNEPAEHEDKREDELDARPNPLPTRDSNGDSAHDAASTEERPHRRVARLRDRVERRLASDEWDAARPLLHEIAAIHPRHPFALEKLVELYKRKGNRTLERHFRSRLRDVTPY